MPAVRFTVHPPLCGQSLGGRVLARVRDGRVARGVGLFLLGAVLAGAIEGLTRDPRLGVFLWLAGFGAAVGVIGYAQWEVARRRYRAGVVVTAQDAEGSSAGADLAEAAVQYCRQTAELTVEVETAFAGKSDADLPIARRLATSTNEAIRLANRLKRDAARVNLIPTMRLHVGFWLGAQLGRSPSKPIGLVQPKGGAGDDSYFLATVLARPGYRWHWRWPARSPFHVSPSPEELTDSDRPRVALVVRTQQRSAAADEHLRAALGDVGVDQILWFRLKSDELPTSTRASTRAVNQIRQDWRKRLPRQAADSYAVFLDITVTIAVALGGYLAGTNRGRWTAYTLDSHSGELVPFPSARDRE